MRIMQKQSKKEYFKLLREKWEYAKALADADQKAKALYVEVGDKVSYHSFYFTLRQMKDLGYEGLPYIDCKTYNGWKQVGFMVKRGEKSKIKGITWVEVVQPKKDPKDPNEEEKKFTYPKLYHLFHKSQTEEIKNKMK